MRPIYKTLLMAGGCVLLGAANVWAANSAVNVVNVPINDGVSIVQDGWAALLGVVGVGYGAHEIVFNRHIATGLGSAGAGLVGGALAHNGTNVSGLMGGATAALIHIPHVIHHVARLVA